MAAMEGISRIEKLASRIALWGGLAGFLLWLALFLVGHSGLLELVFVVAVPVLCGALLWVVAWVIEGFVQPHSS